MAYSKKINEMAEQALSDRRTKVLQNQEINKRQLYKELPRLEEIERQLSYIGAETAKAVVKGKNCKEAVTSLAEKSLALQREMKTILFTNGYSGDALEPKFHCERCKDTGRYDDINGRTVICQCLKNLRANIACHELNKISPLNLSTFESFSLDKYEMDISSASSVSPYERMKKILAYCRNYADTFQTENSSSLLLRGATGLGKTHLSLAIATEVIKKGFGVAYVSAPDVISKMEKYHFSYRYDNEEEIENSLISCDLLIFDDLGTEFQSNYSSSAIYNLVNTRLLNKKPTIISTNLTLKEMEKFYTQRFVSRIVGNFVKMDFLGSDNRGIKGA